MELPGGSDSCNVLIQMLGQNLLYPHRHVFFFLKIDQKLLQGIYRVRSSISKTFSSFFFLGVLR
jgi:hypothetical protein